MSALIDLTGKKFGRLTVLRQEKSHITSSGQSKPLWLCKCDCGQEKSIFGDNLREGYSYLKSCGCLKQVNRNLKYNLVGQKFGKLTVITRINNLFTPKGGGHIQYECKCDCGNIKNVVYSSLVRGMTKSCGCLRIEKMKQKPQNAHSRWLGYGEMSGRFFRAIEKNAQKRNLEFKLTKEFIWNLFIKQDKKCALTGLELSFSSKHHSSDGVASLDRIDSSKGYTINNVQWVHKDINKMKLTHSDQDFIKYCRLVANHAQSTVLDDI
jgi:hypothetical protein